MKPPKPPYGQPCNGCGECCVDGRCPLGAVLFGPGRYCPALWRDGCGLAIDPSKFARREAPLEELRDAAELLIGAGAGCDARLVTEPDDPSFRARLLLWASRNRGHARAAVNLSGPHSTRATSAGFLLCHTAAVTRAP